MKHRPIAGILTNKDRRLLGDVFDIAQYVLGRRVDRGARNSSMLADLKHARSGKRIHYCSQEFAVAVAPAGGRKPRV